MQGQIAVGMQSNNLPITIWEVDNGFHSFGLNKQISVYAEEVDSHTIIIIYGHTTSVARVIDIGKDSPSKEEIKRMCLKLLLEFDERLKEARFEKIDHHWLCAKDLCVIRR